MLEAVKPRCLDMNSNVLGLWQAHQGVYADESGPEMARLLTAMSEDESWPLTVRIVHTAIVPDERGVRWIALPCSLIYLYHDRDLLANYS